MQEADERMARRRAHMRKRPRSTTAADERRRLDLSRLWTAWTGAVQPRRVPVWIWRALMRSVAGHDRRTFNSQPIVDVDYHMDIDYVGDGDRRQRLDVITPRPSALVSAAGALPVYINFHGGGWTSGDKATLTAYCASQSLAGMVVVNASYRRATRAHMGEMLADATAVLRWVAENIASYGGDPESLVLGGDSAGGQIAALVTASSFSSELARHHGMRAVPDLHRLKGLVLHCSVVDFSVLFERGFVLSLGFIRMLVPKSRREGRTKPSSATGWLRREARFLSPIEWLGPGFPPVFVTTSERDYFYRANLNFLARLRSHAIPTDTVVYDKTARNAVHTWQQNIRHPESQEVYRRLQRFIRSVTASLPARGAA